MQILINNLLTNYEVFDNPNSKGTILILPGWMCGSNEWASIANTLSVNHKVIVLDLPGFGKSQQPNTVFDTYDYANFVSNFIKKIGINECILMGHSFGGRLGIILGAQEKWVKKLILVDAAGISKRTMKVKIIYALVKILKPFKIFLPKKFTEKFKQKIGSSNYKSSGEMRKILVKTVNQDLEHLLEKINKETLIVWGDQDQEVFVEETKVLKNKISNAIVRIVWGAKHKPHLEMPQKFIEIVQEFI